MKKATLLFLLLACCSLHTATATNFVDSSLKKSKKQAKNWALQISSKGKKPTTYLSVGLVGKMNRLHGLSLNLGGAVTEDKCNAGIQIGGLFNVSQTFSGIGLAGIVQVYETGRGVMLSGLANVTSTFEYGLQTSIIANINGDVRGAISAAALLNVSETNKNSILLAGLANVTQGQTGGIMVAGLGNITGENKGLQIAGLANINGGNSGVNVGLINLAAKNTGLQLGALNISAEGKRGIQTGLLNIATDGEQSLQIGLLNISALQRKAYQIGLINVKPHTQLEYHFTASNAEFLNAAMRFKNKHTYTTLGLGTHHWGIDEPFTLTATFRAGGYYQFTPQWEAYADLGIKHVAHLGTRTAEHPRSLYAFQPRIGILYMPSPRFGFTIAGGYQWAKSYSKGYTDHKPTIEAGIVFKPWKKKRVE